MLRRRERHCYGGVAWLGLALICVTLVACGTTSATPPTLPAGAYNSPPQFHFRVSFPAGWQANEWHDPTASASATAPLFPLTVIVTRSEVAQGAGSQVSNLTIAILDLHNLAAINKDLQKAVAGRATDKSLHVTTLAGLTAYASQPLRQTLQGSQQIATHTDYYLTANNFEYHISTDVLSYDHADAVMQTMLSSFALT